MTAAPKFSLALLALLVSACAPPPTKQAALRAQPQCALITYPTNERIAGWSVDKFAGRYVAGQNAVTVRRDQHRLLVEGWVLGSRELTADSIESWTWRDGCGVSYGFMLPPDGPGGRLRVTLPDGSTSDWHRG